MLRGIIVGIDRYSDPHIPHLSCAVSDAQGVYKVLCDAIRADELSLTLLTNELASRTAIMHHVGEELARDSAQDDMVLLYFAGHGSPETPGDIDTSSRYLVPYDTQYDRIYSTGIDMEADVSRWCDRVRAKVKLVLIDACFSGRAGGRTFRGPRLAAVQRTWRGPLSLRPLDLGAGTVLISACGEDQVAREDPSLGHGIFTYHLIRLLQPRNRTQQKISIYTLYAEVATSVRTATDGAQIPVIAGRSADVRLPVLSAPPTGALETFRER